MVILFKGRLILRLTRIKLVIFSYLQPIICFWHWRWYLAETRGPFDFIFFLIQELWVFGYFSCRSCWWVISFPHPTFNRTSNRIISFYYRISRIEISNQFAAWEISRLFFTCIALTSIFLSYKSGPARLYEKF